MTLLLSLLGCSLFISDDAFLDALDLDGDGFRGPAYGGEDCDDSDPSVYPGAIDPPYDGIDADCAGDDDNDADGDGLVAAERGGPDCDDTDPLVGDEPRYYFADCDGDGTPAEHGLYACATPSLPLRPELDPCQAASTTTFTPDRPATFDCDDLNPSIHPGAEDPRYDGVDSDCDGSNDYDADHDGYVTLAVPGARPDANAPGLGDCDDNDPAIHPTADDPPYDGIDADCASDNDYDADGDGAVPPEWADRAGGSAPFVNDCDDTDPTRAPGRADPPYDGVDSNCDGLNDYDADGDGWVPIAWAAEANGLQVGDCDDGDARRAPEHEEIWYDGIDGDCLLDNDFDADHDGAVRLGFESAVDANAPDAGDCDDSRSDVRPGLVDPPYDGLDANCDGSSEHDVDGDGFLAISAGGSLALVDCDDNDPDIHPGAIDAAYDGIDSNCDGSHDFDADRDGYVPTVWAAQAMELLVGDCDDLNAAIHPGAAERWYDDVDQDCDQANDFDQDGDGVVRLGFTDRAGGSAPAAGDCDDLAPDTAPGRPDAPYDGVDADCAGDDDFDVDRDGFRHPSAGGPLADCDDDDADVFPGAFDAPYDDRDADCDGGDDNDADRDGVPFPLDCDDADPLRSPDRVEQFYDGLDADCAGDNDFDADGDGFVAAAFPAEADGTTLPGDCDDLRADVNPAATDLPYDGIDADCGGDNDFDADGDGAVSANHPGSQGGTAPREGDCDDQRSDIAPGATDTPYDGIDSDCDGSNDFDADRDGHVASGFDAEVGGTAPAGADCDDADPTVNPGQIDAPYDGRDANCDGLSDFDVDGDGFVAVGFDGRVQPGEGVGDCDDQSPEVYPGHADLPYDGVDADCDGANDFDADRDGFVRADHPEQAGGTAPFTGDCDDLAAAVHPGALDVPYDGIDADCLGDSDDDRDGDGFPGGPSCMAPRCDCDDDDVTRSTGLWSISPGEDLQALVDAACDDADLTLSPGDFTVSELILARPITLRGAGPSTRLLSASGRVIDAPGVDLQLIAMRLEGGDADDGGTLRVSGQIRLDTVELADGTATQRGGLLFVDAGASAHVLFSHFEGGSAESGGAIALGPDALLTLSDSDLLGCDALTNGGAIDAVDAELVLRGVVFSDTTAGSDGGAIATDHGAIDLESIDITRASAGNQGAALSIQGSGGRVAGLTVTDSSTRTTTPSIGASPLPSVVNVDYAGTGQPLLDLEAIDLFNNSAFCGLSVYEPFTGITLHDVRVQGAHGYGINLEPQTGPTNAKATITASNVLSTGATLGARLAAFEGGNAVRLSYATVIGTVTGLTTEAFNAEVSVSHAVAGATNFSGDGVQWSDIDPVNGSSRLDHTWLVNGNQGIRWNLFNPTLVLPYDGSPPFCADCGGVLPLPFDADYRLTGPPSGQGDPDVCPPGSPITCRDPGYWGGPNPPSP